MRIEAPILTPILPEAEEVVSTTLAHSIQASDEGADLVHTNGVFYAGAISTFFAQSDTDEIFELMTEAP